MPTKPKKQKRRAKPAKKIYTYKVICSFNVQFSFTESEVEPDPGGAKGDFNPTDKALRALKEELRDTLGYNYAVSEVEAYAESNELLGVTKV